MKVLVLGAGTVGLSVAAWLSAVCEVCAVTGKRKAAVIKGRITEISLLNGAVVTVGARHGIETPVNTCIADQIRFRDPSQPVT
ncbi:ketopantoate reductase C-terminal domain-containing protein [Methanosphaerula subterraneus]|uniref:ketopantoate reductase C-terminal domain-containing protein n=1 Tax=Methanosphaerula subterraneus TaxID=3350244 RepID=UPI003F84E2FA